jgi:hypothetical protein
VTGVQTCALPIFLAGTIVVVAAVALVTGAELKKRAAVEGEPALPAVESTGD